MTSDTSSSPTPILETARLVLRPLRLEDAPVVQHLFPHWDIVCWLGAVVSWPYPADGGESYLRGLLERRAHHERFDWAICLKEQPEDLVGMINMWADNGSRDQRGFWIAREYQGRGLMTEAAERVTEFAFVELGWPQLWLSNAEGNLASRRVKEKQGAELVAREPQRFVCGEGMREVWLLKREAWLAARGR